MLFFRVFFFSSEQGQEQEQERASNLPPARRARSVLCCAAFAFYLSVRERARRYLCLSLEKRGGEPASKRKCRITRKRQSFRHSSSSSIVVVVAARRRPEKKKSPISHPSFFLSLSLSPSSLIRILIRRWGPVISEDPLKRRQVVYLSERVSFLFVFLGD